MKYDVVTPIDGGTARTAAGKSKTRWHKVGRAWSDTEDKITIVLDSLPFRSEYLYLFKSQDQSRSDRDPDASAQPELGDDDKVPIT